MNILICFPTFDRNFILTGNPWTVLINYALFTLITLLSKLVTFEVMPEHHLPSSIWSMFEKWRLNLQMNKSRWRQCENPYVESVLSLFAWSWNIISNNYKKIYLGISLCHLRFTCNDFYIWTSFELYIDASFCYLC